jgi:hypothetical protein
MSFKEEMLKAMNTYKPLNINWFIFQEIIDKYCIDKAKVKETIKKYSYAILKQEEDKILEELGL